MRVGCCLAALSIAWAAAPAAYGKTENQRTIGPAARRSSLRLQIAAAKRVFAVGEDIELTVTTVNISPAPLRVLRLLTLQCYPVRFDVRYRDDPRRYLFIGPRAKHAIGPKDYVVLRPGQRWRQSFNLSRDPRSGRRTFKLDRPGAITVQATYCGFFGLPETPSNTLQLELRR